MPLSLTHGLPTPFIPVDYSLGPMALSMGPVSSAPPLTFSFSRLHAVLLEVAHAGAIWVELKAMLRRSKSRRLSPLSAAERKVGQAHARGCMFMVVMCAYVRSYGRIVQSVRPHTCVHAFKRERGRELPVEADSRLGGSSSIANARLTCFSNGELEWTDTTSSFGWAGDEVIVRYGCRLRCNITTWHTFRSVMRAQATKTVKFTRMTTRLGKSTQGQDSAEVNGPLCSWDAVASVLTQTK